MFHSATHLIRWYYPAMPTRRPIEIPHHKTNPRNGAKRVGVAMAATGGVIGAQVVFFNKT